MPTLTLPQGVGLKIGSEEITDHNRGPITIEDVPIEEIVRMATGLGRKFVIGSKKRISVSWTLVPSTSAGTVDGKKGAMDLRNILALNPGGVLVEVVRNTSATISSSCYLVGSSFELVKRNIKATPSSAAEEFWNVSVSFEEV